MDVLNRGFLASDFCPHDARKSILEKGFAQLPVSEEYLRPRMAIAFEGFERIVSEMELRRMLPWQVVRKDAFGAKYAQDAGLKYNKEDGEHKWVFHFAPPLMSKIECVGFPVHEFCSFFEALHDLDSSGIVAARKIAEAFDEKNTHERRYPGSLAERLVRATCVTRLIKYLEIEGEGPDAIVHVDRDFLSLMDWASDEGFGAFGPDRIQRPIDELSFRSVATMPGEKFAAATRGVFGLGTAHGARDKRRAKGTRTTNRRMAARFIHSEPFPGDAQWLAANHGRIKEFEKSFCI